VNIGKVTQAIVKIAKNKNDGRGHWYEHAEQKGVVHTYTNKVTKLVVQALEEAGLKKRIVTLSGTGPQRLETFNHFKESKDPLILVSPSAMLGISLDDDLARWQVIAKMPYANLGDPAVAHRKDHIEGWYSWQTSKNIIQACGRIIRSQEDWGITYILDSCFHNHWQWNSGQFPLYIQQALYFTW
jgi:ATP-dependent DNA helicase DinG